MTERDRLFEIIARAMCRAAGDDPNRPTSGKFLVTVPAWRFYLPHARQSVEAAEAAGFLISPPDDGR